MAAKRKTRKKRGGSKLRRYLQVGTPAFKWKMISGLAFLLLLALTYLWYFGHVWQIRDYIWTLPSSIVTDRLSDEGRSATDADRAREILIYFGNSKRDPETLDCSLVFPVKREVKENPRIARTAIEALLEGPTSDEQLEGYYSSLNRTAGLESLAIENQVAIINFDQAFAEGIAGSCQVQAIKAQVAQTLLQFGSVDSVQILVEGKVSTAFQP